MHDSRKTVQSKIKVIIAHEYLSRLRTKAFILTTLLAPLGLIVTMGVPILIATLTKDSTEGKIAIVDHSTHSIKERLLSLDPKRFQPAVGSFEEMQREVQSEKLLGIVTIPSNVLESDSVSFYSRGGGGLAFLGKLDRSVNKVVRAVRIEEKNVDVGTLNYIDREIEINSHKLTDKGVEEDGGATGAIVGYVFGFLMYIMMLLYGSFVMNGVIEEKQNRISEVLASSATPFEMMFGKVVGIGALGLTQIVLWGAMTAAISAAIGMVFGAKAGESASMQGRMEQQISQSQNIAGANGADQSKEQMEMAKKFTDGIKSISPVTIILFVFFFLSGYFIYSCLFASIGSAVESPTEAQQLSMPVTLLLVVPMISIGAVMGDPNGTLATTMSLIPFFAPVIMVARIATTQVPAWQVLFAILGQLVTFLGMVWFASRVYRIGILSYGKKPSFRELIKWARQG